MQKLRHLVRVSLPPVALVAWVLLGPLPAAAQQAVIQYVYDDLNRLIAVVDQQGNAATYTYDAVGNILRIERFDVAGIPGAVGITLVRPSSGKVGTVVEIFGKGFSATTAQNSVSFNGTPAGVTASAPNRIVTAVPIGATTGPISVTTPLGSALSPTPFRVVGAIVIDPPSVTLAFNGSQQFTATGEGGGPAPAVRWSVNDITGGDPGVGTISTEGLFTAPAGAPLDGVTVTVTATHTDDPTVTASATVTIRQPQPIFVAAAGSVSVRLAEQTVTENVTAAVGVVVAESGLRPVIAPGVGVQFFAADPVTALAVVGVALEPLVASISPSSADRETVDLLITITGSGLSGATSLSFLLNNVPDANITISNLVVAPDGGQATAQISIASNAAVGPRVMQITTPAGASTTAGTGGNVFTVQ